MFLGDWVHHIFLSQWNRHLFINKFILNWSACSGIPLSSSNCFFLLSNQCDEMKKENSLRFEFILFHIGFIRFLFDDSNLVVSHFFSNTISLFWSKIDCYAVTMIKSNKIFGSLNFVWFKILENVKWLPKVSWWWSNWQHFSIRSPTNHPCAYHVSINAKTIVTTIVVRFTFDTFSSLFLWIMIS